MKNKYRLLITGAVLAAVAAWFALYDTESGAQAPAAQSPLPPKPPVRVTQSAAHERPAVETSPDASPSAVEPVPAEVLASARMYAAHAPLRAPAIADPDSPENREILHVMVQKALARTAVAPPSLPREEQTSPTSEQ